MRFQPHHDGSWLLSNCRSSTERFPDRRRRCAQTMCLATVHDPAASAPASARSAPASRRSSSASASNQDDKPQTYSLKWATTVLLDLFQQLALRKMKYCIVFIHFYSASHSMSLSEALPNTTIDTVEVNKPKRYRQLQVNDLPMVPTWRIEREIHTGNWK